MSTIKIIFRTNRINEKGEHPLYLRITKHRKSKYISLQVNLKPEYWDNKENRVKKSHPNSQKLNHYLRKKISDAESVALEMDAYNKSFTPQKIKDKIMGGASESFVKFAESNFIELINNNQVGTVNKVRSVVSKIKTFLKGSDLRFNEITVSWLKNYETYLRSALNNKTNTVYFNLKVIRRIINEAISEEIFPQDKNPFMRFSLKWENVKKEFLTEDELLALENLELEPGSMKDHHRNMYVFAAYVGGLRISDVLQLRWKNFDGEKIIVKTQKTGSIISIKLPSKSIEMLKQYKSDETQMEDFIFPILKKVNNDNTDKRILFRAISSATAYTNSDLKDFGKTLGLNKHIHFHTSRHTWATRALRKGIRIEYVSKLMGHNSIKTTQIYTKIVNEELDKAMELFD